MSRWTLWVYQRAALSCSRIVRSCGTPHLLQFENTLKKSSGRWNQQLDSLRTAGVHCGSSVHLRASQFDDRREMNTCVTGHTRTLERCNRTHLTHTDVSDIRSHCMVCFHTAPRFKNISRVAFSSARGTCGRTKGALSELDRGKSNCVQSHSVLALLSAMVNYYHGCATGAHHCLAQSFKRTFSSALFVNLYLFHCTSSSTTIHCRQRSGSGVLPTLTRVLHVMT